MPYENFDNSDWWLVARIKPFFSGAHSFSGKEAADFR
jgi:hypothetical protein